MSHEQFAGTRLKQKLCCRVLEAMVTLQTFSIWFDRDGQSFLCDLEGSEADEEDFSSRSRQRAFWAVIVALIFIGIGLKFRWSMSA